MPQRVEQASSLFAQARCLCHLGVTHEFMTLRIASRLFLVADGKTFAERLERITGRRQFMAHIEVVAGGGDESGPRNQSSTAA